jgi:hypothetical protein
LARNEGIKKEWVCTTTVATIAVAHGIYQITA